MRTPFAAVVALALVPMQAVASPMQAAAQETNKGVGLVVTRSPGRRPSKRDVGKFGKSLRKALAREGGWKPTSSKASRKLFRVDKAARTWRCRAEPVPVEDMGAAGRRLGDAELECALEVAREADLGRVLLVHVLWANGGFKVDLHNIRVDLGRVVAHAQQRISGKRFAQVIKFSSALARRAMKELGGFRLETNVEGADVEMDGMFLGTTPLEQTDMAPGFYKLKITADGYFDWEGEAEVTPGEMSLVLVDLKQPRTSAPPPGVMPSSTMKWGLVGLGAAAAVGGLVLVASSSDSGTRAAGVGLFVAGAVGAGVAFTYEF